MQPLPGIVCHPNGQAYCTTEYVSAEHWLRTTWQGFVSPADAEQGALAALGVLQEGLAPCLLNDNSQIKGPWFDSVAWLQQVWAPQAARLGLRHVAHVAQPHTEADLGAVLARDPFGNYFEVQVFTTPEDAATWLRECQQQDTQGAGR
ncbi:hypothetical protein GCM10023172_13220 [Hymenobacter ginsengisoli]|uniref:STAS/SEC14 domain-containing protein n=1 Tax=Hymenobacter ginsengisoli TaxID=1051626 RepID=A0ABP8Q7U5_9BACT|nr:MULTISPECIES: hypothetical protein [unclassified Hymenobacter]MBO2031909.1 hypothetical protein [Hymenobacter sp. BT559]